MGRTAHARFQSRGAGIPFAAGGFDWEGGDSRRREREEMGASGAARGVGWGDADQRRPGGCVVALQEAGTAGRAEETDERNGRKKREDWETFPITWVCCLLRIGPVEWIGLAGTLTAAAAHVVRGVGFFCLDCRSAQLHQQRCCFFFFLK